MTQIHEHRNTDFQERARPQTLNEKHQPQPRESNRLAALRGVSQFAASAGRQVLCNILAEFKAVHGPHISTEAS
jgi:hypothetical protein